MKKTALITGASAGIGYELAKIFAENGHDLVLTARNGVRLEEIATDLRTRHSTNVKVITLDLSVPEAANQIYLELDDSGITVEYLVNNAGFGDYGLFAESEWKKQEEMIQLNITALTQLTWLFLRDMLKMKKGKILNLASTAAFQPGPLMAVYFATKAFVLSFSEAIAEELEGTGITVTALCPGATESNFQQAASLGESKLVKGKKLPTSAEVARFGFNAMMQGKRVAIHGFMNTLIATAVRFTPRKLTTKVARWMNSPKGN